MLEEESTEIVLEQSHDELRTLRGEKRTMLHAEEK